MAEKGAETILRLENLNTGLEDIPILYSESSAMKNLWGAKAHHSNRTFSIILNDQNSEDRLEYIPLEWKHTVDNILKDKYKQTKILISGSRRSGKSVFAKYLGNVALSRVGKSWQVFFLDCDPKHPSKGSLGLVSLSYYEYDLGNSFIPTNKKIIKSHAIGDVNPKAPYFYYLRAIEDLFETYKNDPKSEMSILIVNIPTITKGLGVKQLEEIYKMVTPKKFIFIGPDLDKETFQDFETTFKPHFEEERNPSLVLLDSPISLFNGQLPGRGANKIGPQDVQHLTLMCYFHYKLSKNTFDFKNRLTHIRPYVLQYSNPAQSAIRAFCVMTNANPLPLCNMTECFTGTVIHLVAVKNDINLKIEKDSYSQIPILNIKQLPSFSKTRCIALAFVHSFDEERKIVRIITPFDLTKVVDPNEEKLIVLRGSIGYPSVDLIWNKATPYRDANKKLQDGKSIPFFSDREPVGIEKRIKKLKDSVSK